MAVSTTINLIHLKTKWSRPKGLLHFDLFRTAVILAVRLEIAIG